MPVLQSILVPIQANCYSVSFFLLFFFNDTATTEIYTLSLHDALPIWLRASARGAPGRRLSAPGDRGRCQRSEEHTSELQSLAYLVCRLLLEKKNGLQYHGLLLLRSVLSLILNDGISQ